jgi:hypothetical protein
MKKIITKSEWLKFGDFSKVIENRVKKGEKYPFEVDEEIFTEFLEVLPPDEYGKDRESIKEAFKLWDMEYNPKFYFLVGEASGTVYNHNVYNTFFETTDGKFYYIGNFPNKKSIEKLSVKSN